MYQIYMLQDQVHLAKSDLQRVISVSGQMSSVGNIVAGFVMGFVYDLYGRKTPMLVFLVFSALALFAFPFWIQNSRFTM